MKKTTCNRRQLMRFALYGAAALPAGHWLLNNPVMAQDKPPVLSPDDPAAKAMAYTHDTTTVDKSISPGHEINQMCANCNLVLGPPADWRGCAIFPGKSVKQTGWCIAWAGIVG